MNGDLISREALNETIDKITWYHINSDGDMVEGAFDDDDALYKAEDIYKAIDNAPTVEPFERIGAVCNENCGIYRPQGEWIVTAEDNDGVHRICCPFCSYEKGSNNTDPIIVTFSNFPKFCENCGADMRGGIK